MGKKDKMLLNCFIVFVKPKIELRFDSNTELINTQELLLLWSFKQTLKVTN